MITCLVLTSGMTLSMILLTGMGTEESRHHLALIAIIFLAIQAATAFYLLQIGKHRLGVIVTWLPAILAIGTIELTPLFFQIAR